MLWSDADGDGWLICWVTNEWGPINLYQNNKGVPAIPPPRASIKLGWWNGISGRDWTVTAISTMWPSTSAKTRPSCRQPIGPPTLLRRPQRHGPPGLVEGKYDEQNGKLAPAARKNKPRTAEAVHSPPSPPIFRTDAAYAHGLLKEIIGADMLRQAFQLESEQRSITSSCETTPPAALRSSAAAHDARPVTAGLRCRAD